MESHSGSLRLILKVGGIVVVRLACGLIVPKRKSSTCTPVKGDYGVDCTPEKYHSTFLLCSQAYFVYSLLAVLQNPADCELK